jgi:hypothetical protein
MNRNVIRKRMHKANIDLINAKKTYNKRVSKFNEDLKQIQDGCNHPATDKISLIDTDTKIDVEARECVDCRAIVSKDNHNDILQYAGFITPIV